MKTYDEILEAMKQAYFEKSGKSVDLLGDSGVRLQAVASELFNLSCFADYLFKQAFPQTATGEYLDKHAKLRNTERKKEAKASVELTFSIDEPAKEAIIIQRGVICSCVDKPYIQFSTSTLSVIRAGETSCVCKANALGAGAEYNVDENTIRIIVNPPSGISSVNNLTKATGGFDGENDFMLRNRLIDSFKVPNSGFTIQSIENIVNQIDEVIDCRVDKDGNSLKVCVRTADNSISDELRDKIENALFCTELIGMSYVISCAQPKRIDLTGRIKLCEINKGGINDVSDDISNLIHELVNANPIGIALDLNSVCIECINNAEIKHISLSYNGQNNCVVPIANNEYFVLDSLGVDYD